MKTGNAPRAQIGVVMGSRSDWETLQHAAQTLDRLGIAHEVRVVSAHRTPERLYKFAKAARTKGAALQFYCISACDPATRLRRDRAERKQKTAFNLACNSVAAGILRVARPKAISSLFPLRVRINSASFDPWSSSSSPSLYQLPAKACRNPQRLDETHKYGRPQSK